LAASTGVSSAAKRRVLMAQLGGMRRLSAL